MDKKDDNKKPSKDKKKDKKDKKDKKKKVVKKKNEDKISQSQIVNIKIGDLSKPKTRRRAAPKAPPPPPQIQRQLQYLPSLAGQAPMIPPPLAPAPTPPPAPAAEPRRTGDFFGEPPDAGFGSSFDLASASLDDLTSIGRGASRPSMTRAFNRPRSDSGVSAMTDPTYTDFDNFSEFNATAPSRFGSSYDLESMTSALPPSAPIISEQLGALASFEDIAQPSAAQTEDLGSVSISSITTNSTPNINLLSSNVPKSGEILMIESDRIPPVQELQPTQTPPEAQPIEAQLVDLPLAVAVPIDEGDPMISETLQAQAVKGDIRPEDEATGGGGRKEAIIFSNLTTEQKNTLFTMYENELFEKKVKGQADAIDRYNLKTRTGGKIKTQHFSKEYQIWLQSKKQVSGAAAESPKGEAKQVSGAAAESPKKEAKKQGSGAAAKSPVKKGGKQVSKKAGKK
jgi:hypothetical protein